MINTQALFAGALLLTLFPACASAPSIKKALNLSQNFCSDPVFRKKQEFLVYSYTKVPAGLPAEQVETYSRTVDDHADRVANQLIHVLASEYFVEDEMGTSEKKSKFFGQLTEMSYMGNNIFSDTTGSGGLRIAWVKDNQFVTWDSGNYPIEEDGIPLSSGKFLKVPSGRVFNKTNAGSCNHFFSSYNVVNDGCNAGTWIKGCRVEGCTPGQDDEYKTPEQGLFSYILKSGFNMGSFIDSHYFVVPEREQTGLCQKAGYEQKCFEFDKDALMNFVHSADKLKFPAIHSSGNPYTEGNKLERLQWYSAYSLDLIMTASTKVSKAVQGDWIISRVDFDPSLMCKYAKPLSDLYTH